jgi:hypothetical protein
MNVAARMGLVLEIEASNQSHTTTTIKTIAKYNSNTLISKDG